MVLIVDIDILIASAIIQCIAIVIIVIGCCVELVQVVPSEGAGCSALSLT